MYTYLTHSVNFRSGEESASSAARVRRRVEADNDEIEFEVQTFLRQKGICHGPFRYIFNCFYMYVYEYIDDDEIEFEAEVFLW